MFIELINNIWLVFLDTAFWLLIGLFAAGVIKSFIAEDTMLRWVGGRGIGAISRAALFGAPLPLCSCGVLPAAIGLHRAGASKEATVSFLISTPETSIDSVAVTYALMGPIMAIFRPISALVNAIGTGLLTTLVTDEVPSTAKISTTEVSSCCSSNKKKIDIAKQPEKASCCETEVVATSCCVDDTGLNKQQPTSKWMEVLSYAGAELIDDIAKWLAVGIVLAGVMLTFIPPDWLAQWGHGLTAMLVMLLVGIPMYVCAVASTPIAAGLLLAGVSPGAVLVFLLVGPATNIASFALIKNELGLKVTVVYLVGLSVFSLMMGLLLEWLLEVQQWKIEAQLGEAHVMLPGVIAWVSAFLLIFLSIRPLRRALIPRLG